MRICMFFMSVYVSVLLKPLEEEEEAIAPCQGHRTVYRCGVFHVIDHIARMAQREVIVVGLGVE